LAAGAAFFATAFATALRADFAAIGFAFEALLDLADFGADFATDFFDEALAMASRRCKSENGSGVTPRLRRSAQAASHRYPRFQSRTV
ncbi:MAG: hypothetical protein JZU55_13260, partial [Afipia sp.]|nr:hypothetical protein [Afipia sp.]